MLALPRRDPTLASPGAARDQGWGRASRREVYNGIGVDTRSGGWAARAENRPDNPSCRAEDYCSRNGKANEPRAESVAMTAVPCQESIANPVAQLELPAGVTVLAERNVLAGSLGLDSVV